MIRNRFDANNQPSQRPYSDLIRAPTAPTAGNVAGLAGPASINTPSVDMSHLTPEERAMIQSVMAKADSELATNSLLPNAAMNSQQQQLAAMQFAGAPSQINMAGGTQQQREQFQLGQANLNRQLNNLQPQQIQGGQMLGFPTQQLTANTGQPMGQLNPMGPGHGGVGLIRAPIGSAMQNSQPQQSIAFQQQQQPAGISYLAQNASNQQQQPESSASSQLPLLEQRTQQLISQINSQFNLGDASTSASQQQQRLLGPSQPLHQHQQPKPQQQQQQQQPTQQSQSHIQRDMLAPNFSHQNSFMAPTQVQSGQHTQMASMQPNCFQSNQTTVLGQQQVTPNNNQALLPMFGGQNQQNFTSQNPAFQQSAQTNCLANQITAVPNQVPFNGQSFASFDLQNPQTLLGPQPQQQQQPQQLLNQFWYGPPFGFGSSEMTSMRAGQHSFGVPIKGATIDERNNIKFRHDLIGRGGARSDHEDCDDADRPNRLSRRSRAARLSRFKSAETAYELESDLERSCRRRQATARESHGQAAKRVSNRRLPKPGQSVSIAVQRSSKGTTSKARQTFGSSSQSSESLLNDDDDDEEGRSSLSSDAGGKTTTNRSAAKCANNKQEDAQSARKQRDTPDASAKSTRLLSELKLTEQTSQVMEQQQQLIKQSQELIKLQQAQLEQQAKKGTVAEEKAGDSEQESGTNKRQPGSEKHDEEDNSSRLARSSPKATRPVTLGEGEDLRTKDRRTNRKQRASSMETRDNQLYTNSSGDSDRAHHHEGACATERNQSGRGVVKGNQRQQRQSSAPNESSRYNTRWPEQDSLLLDSPTSTTDSDLERLASSASLVRRRQVRRQMTTPTSKGSRRTATRHQLDSTGMTPSPLPVVAAIQLHQLQTLNQRDRNNNQTAANEHGQRARTRTRADLLRSRSVCTSPQGFVGLSRTRPSSPDAMSEFSQRKLLPNPPSNAVPLTPSMVRKMVQTQQVAATSSAKLLTSVNAQSTLLTNAHSLRQPCLDQSPSGGSAGHNMGYHHQYHDPRSSKLAPKPIGSYTAKLSGAQVSFAPDQVLTTAARHQNLSALSRADLSKFLDFTYGTSILKSAPQQQQHNNSSSLADSSYTMANYSPAKNYQPAQLGRQLASAIGGNGSGNNGWTRSYHDAPKRAYGQLNSMKQSNQTNSSRVGSSLFYEQHSGYKHRLGDESSSNRGQNYYGTWRRNSEGENSSSRLSYLRPTLLQPSPKHVNFDSGPSQLSSGAGNYDRQPTSGQFSYSTSQPRSSQYSNTLTTTTRPYLSRSSVNFSSVDRYPARASAVDRYSARENLRDSFSPALDYHHFNRSKTNIAGSADGDNASYRSQWAPRTPWSSSGVDMPYSSRLSTARTMDNERRELATALHLRDRLSYLDEEYGGSLSRWSQRSASTRYPYRQRSFDTS